MAAWIKEPISRICDTTSGGTPSRKNPLFYNSGTIPWVKSGELNNNIITETEEHITEEAIINSSAKVFPKGTLLIALYGATIGKLAFLGVDAATNQAVCALFENERVDLKYLYYYLLFSRPNLIKQGQGGAQPNISQGILRKLLVPHPQDKHEQQRIVARIEELFSQLDDAEATLQKTKAQLALYRQAVYASVFKGMEANRSIMEFFDITGGITKNSTRGTMPIKRPYLRVANVYYNRLDLTEIKEIGVSNSEIEKYTLEKNDLLFVEGNGSKSQIGRVAIWDGSIPDIVHQNHIIKGRPNGRMLPEFALFYLISADGRKQITEIAKSTSGLYTLSTDKVRSLKIPYCDIKFQMLKMNEVAERLSLCDSIEQTVNKGLEYSRALRQSILKQIFKGE